MRERQNRKCNIVAKRYDTIASIGARGSCLLLLLITFLAVNPVSGSAVFAEEVADDYDVSSSNSDDTDNVATLDATVSSTVGISFSPAKYYADLAPTSSAGQSARIDLQTTIYVSNSGGYAIYLKTNNPNLVGENNSNNFIPGATTAKTYTNMDVNTWGYAAAADVTSVPNNATYKAVIASGNGDKLAENTNDDIETDTKTIALSFATKINDTKPADTYSNTMMLSVVSNPREVTSWSEITTMQEMTTKICAKADMGATKQLKDTRDGKFYWVTKLPDSKCWMTQNLDLDLSTSKALTSADSDVTSGYTPEYNTADTASSSTISSSNTSQRSWSLGDYRITNPTTSSDCGSGKNSAADCPSQFTAYTTPTTANGDTNAHYILGNHYQWNAATAGTGGEITSGQASSSICPKNWRLPTDNDATVGSFRSLIKAGNIGSDVAKLTNAPYYFVRGGDVTQLSSTLFTKAGDRGDYWSSTPYTSSAYFAYPLEFSGTSSIASMMNDRVRGFSVRCIAR